jgi:hypothetical protein
MSYLQQNALQEMLSHAQIYEQWHKKLSEAAKWSVIMAVITSIILISFFVLGGYLYPVSIWHPDLILDFTENWLVALQWWCYRYAPGMIALNLFNLAIAIIVLEASNMLKDPVREPIHWLAHFSGIQAGLNIVLMVLAISIFVTVIILNVIAAIIMSIFGIVCFIGILSGGDS